MSLFNVAAQLSVIAQKIDEINQSAPRAAASAADAAKHAQELTQSFLDTYLKGHPDLARKVAFGSGVGGSADLQTLIALIRDIRENKLPAGQDPASLALWMQRMEATIKKFIDPGFMLSQFTGALDDFDRKQQAKAVAARHAPSGGGTSNGGAVFGIRLKNGQPVIDILNDGGAGGSSWYKPNDPDYQKLLANGSIPGGW